MVARTLLLACIVNVLVKGVLAQSSDCTFKPPFLHLDFGRGTIQDVNSTSLGLYSRISYSCPTDGHYTFTSFTRDCFGGDWHTLAEDHTAGGAGGNMLLVNSARSSGTFFSTRVKGFKGGKTYQFGAWLINVCKPTRKCPFPLLPNLTIRLQTPAGKTVAQFNTGDLPRVEVPKWTQHRAQFTMPASESELVMTFINNAPGGCGNDFALDDITFRECVKADPAKVVEAKKVPPVTVKKQPPPKEKLVKKETAVAARINKSSPAAIVVVHKKDLTTESKPQYAQPVAFVPAPPVLKQRANPLVRHIETTAGEILIDLYDNGEIDGDTVSIYHNNRLIVARQRLSQKPISFRIQVDKEQPHHEIVMVANNLGAIPPNTSLMIVRVKDKRYQVFISSTEQQNAKVVFELKE